MTEKRDHTLDLLLSLDGLVHAPGPGYWIKYEVKSVVETAERPHGIKYSLTLHDPDGERIFGIDNAHRPQKGRGPAAKSRRPKAADHLHRSGKIYAYEFKDAVTLLEDFDKGVLATLKRKGVKI